MAENYYEHSLSTSGSGRGRGGPRNFEIPSPSTSRSRGRGRGRGGSREANDDRLPSSSRSFQNKRSRDYEDDGSDSNDGETRKKHRESTKTTKNVKHDREQIERERRARMDRLRAEIEEEERDLAIKQNKEPEEKKPLTAKDAIRTIDESELEGLEEDDQMELMLGFSGGFGSTKGQVVEDNLKTAARGAAAKNKARKYRQYMNRKGGFNRPLDKMS